MARKFTENDKSELLDQLKKEIEIACKSIFQALEATNEYKVFQILGRSINNTVNELNTIQLVAKARKIISHRRLRDRMFGDGNLFGEPAWEIMLDLFIATAEGKPISVSSACIGSAGPSTTALRYLTAMDEQLLIERFKHETDSRVMNVRLSDAAMKKMGAILSEIPETLEIG
jgi:hypothetical protein